MPISRPDPIGAFASSVVATMLRRQPLTPGKVTFAWQMAAGAKLARAAVAEFHPPDTIRLRPKDPRWAMEIEHSRAVLTERLKTVLGLQHVTLEVSGA